MARPLKKGLDYFPVSTLTTDEEELLIAKHGLEGYGAYLQLKKKIYLVEGYYADWTEKNLLLFAAKSVIHAETLRKIVATCISEGLFDKRQLKTHFILTSAEIQKTYIKICTDAKRKDFGIDENYHLLPPAVIELPPEETPLPEEQTEFTPAVSTQRKGKDSIGEEIKLTTETLKVVSPGPTGPAAPAKDASKEKKTEPVTIPFWQSLVDAWFAFYASKKNGEVPTFKGRPTTDFKKLVWVLMDRARRQKFEWTQKYAVDLFNWFLAQAYADQWLADHFLISNLLEQFDVILARAAKKKPAQADVIPKGFAADLKYLCERSLEADFDPALIPLDTYDRLVTHSYVKVGYADSVPGATWDEKRLNAILSYLKAQNAKPVANASN